MKTIDLEDASRTLADYASHMGSEAIVVTSNRKPVAALVPLGDIDREALSVSLDPAFLRIIRRARSEVRRGDVHTLDEVKQELLTEAGKPGKGLQRARKRRR